MKNKVTPEIIKLIADNLHYVQGSQEKKEQVVKDILEAIDKAGYELQWEE